MHDSLAHAGAPSKPDRLLDILSPRVALALVVLVSLLLVADGYRVFSHTWDEPAHIAAGLELWDQGTYTYEQQHPPLARLAVALGPYLDGQRSQEAALPAMPLFFDRQLQMYNEGRRILYQDGLYDRVLTLARLGILPFLVVTLLAAFAWARRLYGAWPAVLAAAFVMTAPTYIGNAGLATLDVPLAALVLASLFLFTLWLDRPTWRLGIALGAVTGAAVMAKFTAIPFLGVSFPALFVWRWWVVSRAPQAPPVAAPAHFKTGLAAAAALLVVWWMAYGFTITTLVNPENRPYEAVENLFGAGSALSNLVSDIIESRITPIFVLKMRQGIDEVLYHNELGHLSYLLGEVRTHGWWYFYLVGIATRTPLPLLILGLSGFVLLVRRSLVARDWRLGAPALAFVAILLFVSISSNINLGIRHLLIAYPLLAIGAAYTVAQLIRAKTRKALARGLAAVLLAWQGAAALYAHPDDMAYFNLLVAGKPERVLISADLDWGQDLKRLEQSLRARGIEEVAITLFSSADLSKHDLPSYKVLQPHTPVAGWVAISLWRLARSDDYAWLRAYTPVARIGTSIDLYYIEPGD